MMRGRTGRKSWAVIGLCLWAVASMAPKWAQAIPLNVDTDPVPYSGFIDDKKFVSGEIDILSIDSDRIELKITADQKTFSRFRVLAVAPDLSTKTPDGGGAVGDSGGEDVDFAFVLDDEAIFSVKGWHSGGKNEPKMTDPFFVDYSGDPLAVGDMLFFRIFSGGGKGGEKSMSVIVKTTIIPEPTTALLMGIGLGGLGLLGTLSARRRR